MSFTKASRFKVDTKYFSPQDLNLFVDSLEILTRLAVAKKQREEKAKEKALENVKKKLYNLPRISSSSMLDDFSSSEEEAEEEINEQGLCKKCRDEETYFSASSGAETSPRTSMLCQHQLHKNRKLTMSRLTVNTSSDSEDSGVSGQDINTESPEKPHLKFQRRFLRMMTKRETNKITPAVELVAQRTLEEYEALDMYKQEQCERLQARLEYETLKHSKKTFSTLYRRQHSPEKHFLSKAISYLTL